MNETPVNPAVLRYLNAHDDIAPPKVDRTTDFDRGVYLDMERNRWRWVPRIPPPKNVTEKCE